MSVFVAHVNAAGERIRSTAGITAAVLLLFALAACSGSDSGPITQCTVRDGAGQTWIASDVNPLAAQERALIDCGAESRTPDSCVAVGCDRHW